jgi:hypothetical protein
METGTWTRPGTETETGRDRGSGVGGRGVGGGGLSGGGGAIEVERDRRDFPAIVRERGEGGKGEGV